MILSDPGEAYFHYYQCSQLLALLLHETAIKINIFRVYITGKFLIKKIMQNHELYQWYVLYVHLNKYK